ncbi:Molybdenum ABC transporter permease protein ModB [hydrothermal vent metagenome]|uniref:Molybdenum ABC transporter permease protein ModB n=1 Tax=hydrothermal vent metagenome TaxID=652676 RepID=A0A3B0UY03_9ZZZZ
MLTTDLTSLWLSFKLAAITVVILLIIGIPLAKWLAFSRSRAVPFVSSIVVLPLVLPPTVLGFYLLGIMRNESWLGSLFIKLTDTQLIFSFTGLVVASVVYSLPFVVQPMVATFNNIGIDTIRTAQSLGANKRTIFWRIILPLSKNGIISASILGFVHTLGEFGVVLMVGGNIPGQTRVVAIEIFNHVENLELQQANQLSLILLIISFAVILWMNIFNKNSTVQVVS